MHKVAVVVSALTAAASLLTASPAVAAAAKPCWQKVIQDWSDHNGAIQGRYSPRCLHQAIRNTPEDLRDYTSIIDDISALLYGATDPQDGGNGTGSGTNSDNSSGMPSLTPTPPNANERARKANEAVPGAGTKQSIPDSSRSIPLPLLILGALALAAALAAAAPPLIKRLRTRFPRLRPAPESVRPPS